jgi:hypothetical protein
MIAASLGQCTRVTRTSYSKQCLKEVC